MAMIKNEEHLRELYKAIISLKSVEDCEAFFDDLCTYKELEQMSQRLYAAKLFLEGKTYSEIIALTDISSTTLSRISKCITHGKGGYKKVLENLEEEVDT